MVVFAAKWIQNQKHIQNQKKLYKFYQIVINTYSTFLFRVKFIVLPGLAAYALRKPQ